VTAVELPTEFDGWVEGKPPLRGNWVSVEVRTGGIGSNTRVVTRKYFVPPKPRPVLPDVKPGAVIRYHGWDGGLRRAVREVDGIGGDGKTYGGTWTVWHEHVTGSSPTTPSSALIAAVDDDGFTVELDGL
jgi:hypothetical protein